MTTTIIITYGLFVVVLVLIVWVVLLSRMFFITNAAMCQDMDDLERSSRDLARLLRETIDLIEGLVQDRDIADKTVAEAESALAAARSREVLAARRFGEEGEDDVVYPNGH